MANPRVLSALTGSIFLLGLSSSVAHAGPRPKLDRELSRRAAYAPSLQTTSTIVTLKPGAQLPWAYKPYVRSSSLGLVNGYVLDLPNGMLNTIAADANVDG